MIINEIFLRKAKTLKYIKGKTVRVLEHLLIYNSYKTDLMANLPYKPYYPSLPYYISHFLILLLNMLKFDRN